MSIVTSENLVQVELQTRKSCARQDLSFDEQRQQPVSSIFQNVYQYGPLPRVDDPQLFDSIFLIQVAFLADVFGGRARRQDFHHEVRRADAALLFYFGGIADHAQVRLDYVFGLLPVFAGVDEVYIQRSEEYFAI